MVSIMRQCECGLMGKFISIIIPNYNGGSSIGKCLAAAFASRYEHFEVVVIDDCSTDDSVEIIEQYPSRLIRLDRHSGAGAARNAGAANSKGEVLFFTDADCLIREDTLSLVNKAVMEHPGAIIGGTYTPVPYDDDFYSTFQSLFIHYSETKNAHPDYIAGHAMAIDAGLFKANGGFREKFLPIPEDVEFSHQSRRAGIQLIMRPEIQVSHIFNFTCYGSLRNAYRKSRNWTLYSLMNRDLLSDSGTASTELKAGTACLLLNLLFLLLGIVRGSALFLAPVSFLFAFTLFISRRMIVLFYREKGIVYALAAALYWTWVYPLPVGVGAIAGMVKYAMMRKIRLDAD